MFIIVLYGVMLFGVFRAEKFLHQFNQLQCTVVIDKVKNTISFLVVVQDTFRSEYAKMLRDITLSSSALFDDLLHSDLVRILSRNG